MLHLSEINVSYGKARALRNITIEIAENEVVALLGANGAGKSSTLRAISGLKTPDSGEILFLGENIKGLPPNKIVKKGISHCPEGRRIFPELSVYENLVMMGAYQRSDKNGIQESLEYVYNLFPKLKEKRKLNGGTLSGGEQQMLAIGRAIMSKPSLLLLDEPTLGLAPAAVHDLARSILEINKTGITVLLVEQNASMALRISDRAYILEVGEIILKGMSKDLINEDQVKRAYLGM